MRRNRLISFLKTAGLFIVFYPRIQYAQPLLFDVSAGLNTGVFRNRLATEKPLASVFSFQPSLQLHIWKKKIGLLSIPALEYVAQPNRQTNNLQLDRAIYFTPGLRVNISGNPLGKKLFIEYGFGVERRIKVNESSYWNVGTAGNAKMQFEKRYTLLPFHFALMKPGKKANMRYRLNLSLQTPSHGHNSWAFSTASFGIDLLKPLYIAKKYYQGTHRTLQVDDVWHPDQ